MPEGVLHVSAMAASCDTAFGSSFAAGPTNEYPACHVHQQDWGVPLRLTETGADRLPLVLAGMDNAVDGGMDGGMDSGADSQAP